MTGVRLWVVGVVAVLGAGAVVLVDGGQLPWNGDSGGSCRLPASVATGPASDAGDDVRVVEQGFTKSVGRLSVGAVVRYTGTGVAYGTSVSVQAFDSARRPVGAPAMVEVPVLLPGQRVGIGSDAQLAVGVRIGSVWVRPVTTHRLPAGRWAVTDRSPPRGPGTCGSPRRVASRPLRIRRGP